MITDGDGAQPIRDFYEVNYTPFRLLFFDNFGDNYTVAAWAKGYQRARPGHPLRPVLNQLDALPVGYNQTGVRLLCANQDRGVHAYPNAGALTASPNVLATCADFTAMN